MAENHDNYDPEERLPEALEEYQEIIEAVIRKAEKGLDPEQALESLIAQVPQHLQESLRKIVKKRLKLRQQVMAHEAQRRERKVLGGMADIFADLSARIRGKISPLELERVRETGKKLVASGLTVQSLEDVGAEQTGQLATPQTGRAGQKDTGISGPGT